MGVFADLRATLAADLDALGVPVHPSWPPTFTTPCVFLSPPLGGDYITAGPQFGGTYTLAVDLVILVEHSTAETGFAALETLVELALLHTMDWALSGVDSPSPITVTDSGAEYLGTILHLRKSARLT